MSWAWEAPPAQKKGKSRISKQEAEDEDEGEEEANEDSEVETTLRQILKKSPVVIFSKTYCPYSKRAKGVLLEKYIIEPAPYVVELDEHPLGSKLQALLAEKTGRKTVPNILVDGVSVGGGDDIAGLDTRKTLIDKFKSLGGKKLSMKQRFTGSVKDKGLREGVRRNSTDGWHAGGYHACAESLYIDDVGVAAGVTVGPVVHVRNGSYEGLHLPSFQQDVFLGMPYAQDTGGRNRFRVPQSLDETWEGVRPPRSTATRARTWPSSIGTSA
ncbi:hypothetical protein NUW58_g4437 [Xylaria curta]|uniref:Uncharacterized protein n=1 Tax=Xylaria curta TaxID=42375 RepID=A0ACC1P8W8_9PEZI|nr:hypothetical protein NUW58_g4437 [Xylaria curta]